MDWSALECYNVSISVNYCQLVSVRDDFPARLSARVFRLIGSVLLNDVRDLYWSR